MKKHFILLLTALIMSVSAAQALTTQNEGNNTLSGTPEECVNVAITVDNPEHVVLKHSNSSTRYPLTSGLNIISLPANTWFVVLSTPSGYITQGVIDDGYPITYEQFYFHTDIYGEEAPDILHKITVTTAPRERDLRAIIISNDYDGTVKVCTDAYADTYGTQYELPLEDFKGHKLVRLCNADIAYADNLQSPYLLLEGNGDTAPTVEQNNKMMYVDILPENQLRYWDNYCALGDTHIVKIFGNGVPDMHKITFTTDLDPEKVSIIREHISPRPLLKSEDYFYDPEGTTLHIEISSDIPSEVKVNDTTLTPGEDGRYMFTLEGPTKVSVMRSVTGIDAIGEDTADDAPAYYNLQGIRVDRPTSGTYIVVRPSGITKETIR